MLYSKGGYVYILTNKNHSVLYIGVTSDLRHRLWQHKTKFYPKSFSAKYNVNRVVFYKYFNEIMDAIRYEKYLKGKSRGYKETLIVEMNPSWNDLTALVNEFEIL